MGDPELYGQLLDQQRSNYDRLLEVKDNLADKVGREEFEGHESVDNARFAHLEKQLDSLTKKLYYLLGGIGALELLTNADKAKEVLAWISK